MHSTTAIKQGLLLNGANGAINGIIDGVWSAVKGNGLDLARELAGDTLIGEVLQLESTISSVGGAVVRLLEVGDSGRRRAMSSDEGE